MKIEPVTFTKQVDQVTPALIRAFRQSGRVDLRLLVRRTGAPKPHLIDEVTQGRILSLTGSTSNEDDVAEEHMQVMGQRYEVSYSPQNAAGELLEPYTDVIEWRQAV